MPSTSQRDTASDADLVADAQAGDRGALSQLLRRHETRLYHVVLGVVRNHDDAQDATQDALIKIVQNLDKFRGDAQFTTWITRIAVNQAISLLRKQKRRPALSLHRNGHSAADFDHAPDYADRLEQHREPAPFQRVQEQETHARLRDAVAGLEETFRVVLVLRDFDGMDYQQIAETLELPLGTVKSRLFRARLLLREALRPDQNDPAPSFDATA